jgi:hypothetical protein
MPTRNEQQNQVLHANFVGVAQRQARCLSRGGLCGCAVVCRAGGGREAGAANNRRGTFLLGVAKATETKAAQWRACGLWAGLWAQRSGSVAWASLCPRALSLRLLAPCHWLPPSRLPRATGRPCTHLRQAHTTGPLVCAALPLASAWLPPWLPLSVDRCRCRSMSQDAVSNLRNVLEAQRRSGRH